MTIMIMLFSTLMFSPKSYHDSDVSALISRSGLVESKSAYEEDFYPALKAIHYQGFIRE